MTPYQQILAYTCSVIIVVVVVVVYSMETLAVLGSLVCALSNIWQEVCV